MTRYAVIDRTVRLPGPITASTGLDQYFHSNDEAQALYPVTADINDSDQHQAAAVLALCSMHHPVLGYLAMHFPEPQLFLASQRLEFRSLAGRLTESLSPSWPASPTC